MKNINKLLIGMILIMAILPMVSAQMPTLGTFKQGECVNLLQTCSDCNYNTITSVLYPDSSQALGFSSMTKTGTVYNYTFCNTNTTGTYLVNGFGDQGGSDTVWNYSFEITPSGILESIAFWIFLFVLAYILIMVGLSYNNIGITYFGGSIGLFLALYCLPNGIYMYKNTLTNVISLLTLCLSIFSIFKATMDLVE